MIDSNDPRLTAYVLGELDAADKAELEQAIAASPDLQAEVDAIRRTVGMLSEQLQAEQCPELTTSQRDAVLQQAAAPVVSLPAQKVGGWTWRQWTASIVALGTVASIAVALMLPGSQSPREAALRAPTNSQKDGDLSKYAEPAATVSQAETWEESVGEFTFEGTRGKNEGRTVVDAEGNAVADVDSLTTPLQSRSISVDPNGKPTGDFDFSFSQRSFESGSASFGGFKAGESGGVSGPPQIPSDAPATFLDGTVVTRRGAMGVDVGYQPDSPQLSAGEPAGGNLGGGGGGFGGGGLGDDGTDPNESGLQGMPGEQQQASRELDRERFSRGAALGNRPSSGAVVMDGFSRTEVLESRSDGEKTLVESDSPTNLSVVVEDSAPRTASGPEQANPRRAAVRSLSEDVSSPQPSSASVAARTSGTGQSGPPPRANVQTDFLKLLTDEREAGNVRFEVIPDDLATAPASEESAESAVKLMLVEETGAIVIKGRADDLERTKRMLAEIEKEEMQPGDEPVNADNRERLSKAISDLQSGREIKLDLVDKVADKKQNTTPQRTWRRAAATPNASRLQIGDQDELLLEGMQVNVLADGFRARVLLDLYYYNNRGQQLEGNFKLRLPNDASLYYFAFGQSTIEYTPQADHLTDKGFLKGELLRASGLDPRGILAAREGSWTNVKEARVVPREKAAHAYSETVRRRVDPALVEWAGAGVFNARVFPLMPNKLHRVVVGYDVNLQQVGEDLVYQLDLPADATQCMIDLNVSALPGTSAEVTPETRPFTSGGRAYYHLNNPEERRVEVRFSQTGPTLLTGKDEQAGDFFAARFIPQLPSAETQAGSSHAIFLVDTSLSSRPDKFNVWLNLLETLLTKNRDSLQQFAVLFFDIENHWWKGAYTENTEANVGELMAYCHSLSLEGATDLGQALREATAPSWRIAGESVKDPDLFLLSDGALTWGEANVHRLGQTLQGDGAGALFAYQTGLAGTATGLLEHLTRETGGAVFSVANESEIATTATAHRQRPWRVLDVSVPGGQDLLVAGRPRFIYAGQPLTVVGRGEPDAQAIVRVKQGDVEKTLEIALDRAIESELTPRLYGQVAVGQLEDLGGSLEDVAVAYSRHFRVTQQTCSLLMLESEADYQRFNIKPEDDVFVVRSTPAADLVTKKLDELAEQLADAKAAFVYWLEKMEAVPGLQFKTPTALRLVIDRLPREAFEVDVPRLSCEQHDRSGVSKEFQVKLEAQQLDYDSVTAEAARRFGQQGGPDALRTLSSLVEQNPGDPVLTRDVAFSAIEWGLPGQAYPLLQRTVALRPFEPPTYQALAQCLAELGRADLAVIYYEVALNAQWNERYKDVHSIVAVEYAQLLRRIANKQLTSHVPEYAEARLASLVGQLPVDQADLVITMMWNTDRTDVDLHIIEPTGEECYYEHPRTALGGQITKDVTEGFGPEMYSLATAKPGDYKILANYYAGDNNRTQVRTKVYITIYEDLGRPNERIVRKTITLNSQKDKRELTSVVIEK